MHTYRLIARPNIHFLGTNLTEAFLEEAIAGAVVRELTVDAQGHHTVDLQLARDSDEQALDEIVSLLERLGFSILEATVSEWASEVFEGAVVGLLGGGTLGLATEKGPVAAIGAVAGAIVGGLVGSEARRLATQYRARRTNWGWTFAELSPSPTRPGLA
jgi:hypothetical protein